MSNAYRLTNSIHTRWEPMDGKDTRDGKGSGKRPGRHVTYKAGDGKLMYNLTAAEIRRLGGRIELASGLVVPVHSAPAHVPAQPAPEPKPAPVAPESAPDPEPVLADVADTPWQTLKARVADMDDADEVRAILEAEEAGKERPAVLGACRARLGELGA